MSMTLGARIKTLRKAAKLTQYGLADRTKVSRIYIQALESNRRMPSMKLLGRLAEVLNVEVEDIVKTIPGKRGGRIQLEEILENGGRAEILYRGRRISDSKLRLVGVLVEAVVSMRDAEEEQPERSGGGTR